MRSTKKTLLLSVLSLIMCVVMLMGTTYAWFTDSVKSGVNQIIAGNLDIDVLHTNAKVTDESVEGKTNLFTDKDGNAIKWEPGVISYETFTVKNLGTLALKYKLAMNITDYNALNGHTLKEVLKAKVLTGDKMLSSVTRDTVAALDWNTTDTLDVFNTYGELAKGASDVFQVIVYWQPTANDNLWNVNNGQKTSDGEALFVDFGISVVATQLDSENDSFSKDYDKNIVLPDLPVSINKTFKSAPITNKNIATETVEVKNESTNTGVATMPKAAVEAVVDKLIEEATDRKPETDVSTVIYLKVETAEKTETAVTYNIDLSAIMTYTDTEGNEKTKTLENLDGFMGDQIITAKMNIGKGLSDVTVKHDGTPMTKLTSATQNAEGFFYEKVVGDLTIKSKTFSPFNIDYTIDAVASVGETAYATLEDAIAAAKEGDTVIMTGDVALSATKNVPALLINKSIIIDGNGNTLTVAGDSTSDSYGIYVNADEEISAVIKNLTLNTTGTERAIRFGGKAGGTVEDVTITTEAVGIHVKGTGSVTMNNVDVTVNAIPAFTAHKRAGVVVGAETTAYLNDSKVTVVTPDKTENTLTWGKGLYVGTNAKGKLIVNNSEVTADFALAIDGSSDQNKLNNITVNSGKISGDLGSPGGYSYKEIVIKGGSFNPYSVNGMNSSFADKTTATHRMIISGGDFSVEPDAKYIADGYFASETDGVWKVDSFENAGIVASIGKEHYETLQAAVDAAKSGDIIVLHDDINSGFTDIEQILNKGFSVDSCGKWNIENDQNDWGGSGYRIKDEATGILYYNGGKQAVCSNYRGTDLTIPEGVEEIVGAKQFANTGVVNIYLPSTIKVFGCKAFCNCKTLQKMYYKVGGEYVEGLPQTLTYIGVAAFQTTPNFAMAITIPDAIDTVCDQAFYESGITSVTLHSNIQGLAKGAFRACANLTEVTLPSSIVSLGNYVFRDCANLLTMKFEFEEVPESFGSFSFASVSALFNNTAKRTILVKNKNIADALWGKLDSVAKANYTIKDIGDTSIVYYPAT